MLLRAYQKVLALAASPYAAWWLAAIAFAESSFFSIRLTRCWSAGFGPTARRLEAGLDLHRRQRRRRRARLLHRLAVFNQIAQPLLHAYHYEDAFARFQATYAEYGLWVILVKGLTPIPYKIVTIASGAAHFNFAIFMAASAATRGARFFLVAALLRRFGEPIRDFIERRLTLVTTAAALTIAGGFLALRFL